MQFVAVQTNKEQKKSETFSLKWIVLANKYQQPIMIFIHYYITSMFSCSIYIDFLHILR